MLVTMMAGLHYTLQLLRGTVSVSHFFSISAMSFLTQQIGNILIDFQIKNPQRFDDLYHMVSTFAKLLIDLYK